MPIISTFFGIVIRMYYREHEPAHFHAEHAGQNATFDFDGGFIAGEIRSRRARERIRPGSPHEVSSQRRSRRTSRGGRGYVIARALDPSARFDVSSDSTLGGCPVDKWLEMPRALDANGKQRLDLFGFCLKNVGDTERLTVGLRVELTDGESSC